MTKNCMNCERMVTEMDGTERRGQHCLLDPTMRVNRRMTCEEWRSSDYTDEGMA